MTTSTSDYKLLTTSTGVLDDADYAGTQVAPTDVAVVAYPVRVGYDPSFIQVEFVLEWLDAAEAVVVGAGSFTFAVVKIIDRPGAATSIVVDSAAIAAVGSRPFVASDLRIGDTIGVRITGITAPATTTHWRVFYREDQR